MTDFLGYYSGASNNNNNNNNNNNKISIYKILNFYMHISVH